MKRLIQAIETPIYRNEKLLKDTFEYIGEYLKHATKCDIGDEDQDSDISFMDFINEGGLVKPPPSVVCDIETLETVFRRTVIITKR